MTDVTVVGLGEMGTALAAAFIRSGKKVTIWNRTRDKARELTRNGAVFASSVADAIAASPVVVICVSDYNATRQILDSKTVQPALQGRVLVQLSTGTPKEARDMDTWVRAQGADYLDGGILAWPRQIGDAETAIIVSGQLSTFKQYEPVLRILAGNLAYVEGEISSSAALFSAILSYLAGTWIGMCHGALICKAEGLSTLSFGQTLASISSILGADAAHMGNVIEKGLYLNPESTLATAGNDIARLVQHASDAGINSEFPVFAASLFRRAINAGYGSEEHVAVFKVLNGTEGLLQ